MAVINWNTVPDYDEWGFDTWWDCQDWIMWHKRLVEHFNKPTANDIWNYAYAKSGSLSGNLDCRTTNNDFRKYVRENGLSPYEGAGVFTPVLQGYGTASDLVSGGLDTVSNVGSGVFGGISSIFAGDGFKKTISVVAIVGGIIGVAYVYKAFKNK
jgi:hypothetical protein